MVSEHSKAALLLSIIHFVQKNKILKWKLSKIYISLFLEFKNFFIIWIRIQIQHLEWMNFFLSMLFQNFNKKNLNNGTLKSRQVIVTCCRDRKHGLYCNTYHTMYKSV